MGLSCFVLLFLFLNYVLAQGNCATCVKGFYASSGFCTACIQQGASCAVSEVPNPTTPHACVGVAKNKLWCTTCAKGFYLGAGTGICYACTSQGAACAVSEVNNPTAPHACVAGNKLYCSTCASGYTLSGGLCVVAPQPPVTPPPSGIPLWSENFDSAATGASLLSLGLIDSSGVVSTTNAYSGKAGKLRMEIGSDCALTYGFAKELPTRLVEGDEFWVQGMFYFPVGWNFTNFGNRNLGGTAPKVKFFRLLTLTANGGNAGYNDVLLWQDRNEVRTRWQCGYEGHSALAYDGLDGWCPGCPQAPDTGIVPGQWRKIEYYVKLHSNAEIARMRLWEAGVLNFEISNMATLINPTDYAPLFRYSTYVNGGAPATQDMWIDNFKIYTSASPPTNFDAKGNRFIG